MRWVATSLMLIGILSPAASAADDIVLRTAVEPAEAWVGQRVILQIDVLAEDGWAQISKFGDVDIAGAYLIRTESQGSRLQETIDGVAYTGQRYEVSIYPQRDGFIKVPAISVEVTTKTWGADAQQSQQQRQTPVVTLEVKMPPGGEGERGLISTKRLSAEQQWAPTISEFKVGDALTRTVTIKADDVSAMAFAPLEHEGMSGVGIYPAEPTVSDRTDRGGLTGERVETVTYVFEHAGAIRIPDIMLSWWNVSKEKLETITLSGREFEVAPGPVGMVGASAVQRPGVRGLWLPGGVVLVAIGFLLRFGRPLMRRWKLWRCRRQQSEARYFKRALISVRSENAHLALRDIMRWLDRINEAQAPAQLQAFVSRYSDSNGQVAINRLLNAVATDGRLADPAPLVSVMTVMRMRWLETGRPRPDATFVLPDLN